jgi:hypothetical protein
MKLCIVMFGLAFSSALAWGESESPNSIAQATAKAYCTPSTVRIGEPFTLTLDIVHDSELRVLMHTPEESAGALFGDNWELLEEARTVRLPIGDGTGNELTQVRWRLFGLEPGEFELETMGADCVASGAVQRIPAQKASLAVGTELAEAEDASRGLLGFRELPPDVPEPLGKIMRGAAIAGGGLGVLLFVLWMRRRKPQVALAEEATPLARLQGLDPTDEQGASNLYYELARCVRLAVDQTREETLMGSTDEEWLDHQRAQADLPTEFLERTRVLLDGCGQVKYASTQPTRWATEEALKQATDLCSEALELRAQAEVSA